MSTLAIDARTQSPNKPTIPLVARSSLYLTMMLLLSVFCTGCEVTQRADASDNHIRALSLRMLQIKLEKCEQTGSWDNEVLQLAGLTDVLGIVVDRSRNDLVILGTSDRDSPPLRLDDLAVAMRASWHLYADPSSHTYSDPGCSIDPDPNTIRSLMAIQQDSPAAGSAGFAGVSERWRDTCRQPQTVRVLGVPFDTHFASVMVTADYDMKRLADGTDDLTTPGFVSLSGLRAEEVRSHGLSAEEPSGSLNRFWFCPGKTSFVYSDGVYVIKECSVRLLTEQMHAGGAGQLLGSGGSDPLARKFADDFTILYQQVENERPEYRELRSLFRLVALARLIKTRQLDLLANTDLSYLLERFAIPQVRVEKTLPGRDSVTQFQMSEETARGETTIQHWLGSCGGVEMSIDTGPGTFHVDSTGITAPVGGSVLKAKPRSDSLYWNYTDESCKLSDLASIVRDIGVNRSSGDAVVLTVANKPGRYQVYGAEGELVYSGLKMSDLVRALQVKLGADRSKTVYFDMDGFSPRKAENFATTFRIHDSKLNAGIDARYLPRGSDGSAKDLEALFAPGLKLEGEPGKIETESAGSYKGWAKTTLTFLVQMKNAVRRVTITLRAKSEELARAAISKITSLVPDPEFRTKSLERLFSQVRKELEATDDQLIFEMYYEVGDMHIVDLREGPRIYQQSLTNPAKIWQ